MHIIRDIKIKETIIRLIILPYDYNKFINNKANITNTRQTIVQRQYLSTKK